jgi:hypothetical protein
MAKGRPNQFAAFDRLMGELLTVPKSVVDERMKAHKEQAALNPNKRGPKPKVKRPSDVASRDAS